MRRRLSLCFAAIAGVAALASLIAACSGGGANNMPANTVVENSEPKAPPLFWDDQDDLDWIYRNQFKATMRMLWVDCAKMVTMGRGDDREPNYELIEAYAKDVSRRADRMAIRWEAFNAPGKALVEAVGDKDWLSADAENTNFGKACDDCHTETWSPVYQHATKKVIAGWLENKLPSEKHMELNEGEPPPAVENRKLMQDLAEHHTKTEKAILAKDGATVLASTKVIMEVAEEWAKRWRSLQGYADAMATAAADKDRAGLRPKYRDMASQCHACHAVHAVFLDPKIPPRKIHNPMPWD